MEKNYIKVICPHCGNEMDIPYIYDGTYEIKHRITYLRDGIVWTNGCENTFYIAILDGELHVHRTKEDLQEFLRLSKEVRCNA
ncbi:MAG: hypothetical protein ANIMEMIM_00067 [Candidatus Argoarchaeum ethanivorans]|uniref:Uncharacterized protein n=1 Tax=Candidatus Argoarchaeum ethanivorans TaxID=2608793 RepID=A0A811T626_9EURY|nr:MAG: hypothetical protein ANIMEMIM_00067 [Candidatus Argoarchaeum ethanivorans]